MSQGLIYYVADLETNGLKTGFHEICELSIIRCSDRMQLSRQVKVNHPLNSSYDALRITNKTIQDLAKGISKQTLIQEVEEFIAEDKATPAHRCLTGHNINFDKRFLHHLWDQHQKSFPIDLFLDTLPLSKRMAAQMGQGKAKLKLENALELFGLKKTGISHSAKGDTQHTYLLWKHLMDNNVEYLDLIKRLPHHPELEEPENLADVMDEE